MSGRDVFILFCFLLKINVLPTTSAPFTWKLVYESGLKKKIKTECPVWNSDCSYLCLKSSFLQWFCLHMNRESQCSEQDPMSTCGICEFITNSSQEMDFTDLVCPFQLRMFHGSFSHSAFSLFIQLGICKAKKL